MLKVRDGKLDWAQVMRSNDIYKGLPYNLVQFTTLQEVMAGWIGIEVGGYYHLSDSLHVYKGEEVSFVTQSNAVSANSNLDVLALPFTESNAAWSDLNSVVDLIVDTSTSAESLKRRVEGSQLPEAFRNIARVLVADGLRRRRLHSEVTAMMAGCTNKLYVQMWQRWNETRKATVVSEFEK
jgi:thymidylate synthase